MLAIIATIVEIAAIKVAIEEIKSDTLSVESNNFIIASHILIVLSNKWLYSFINIIA